VPLIISLKLKDNDNFCLLLFIDFYKIFNHHYFNIYVSKWNFSLLWFIFHRFETHKL